MRSPITNSTSPATYGGAGPRRSAASPANTTPIMAASRNALNTHPYRRRPPRSLASTGTAGATARASDATNVMVRTSPSVSARCSGAHNDSRLCAVFPAMPAILRKDERLLLAGAAAGLGEALLAGADPRHHRAQLGADLLDLVVLGRAPVLVEVGTAVLVLGDPLVGEASVLDLVEDAAHLGLGLLVHDAGTSGVVAVLGGVRDREVHARDAVLVHEVHDQLQLVQALEVRRLRLVAGAHEGLEAGLDEFDDAAAQHYLLAEQIGLRLLLESRLEHACPGGADGVSVGEGGLLGLARRVLGHGDERGHPAAALELAPYQVARALGRDHADVDT